MLVALGMRDLDCDYNIDTILFADTYRRAIDAITAMEAEKGRTSFTTTMAGFANVTHASYYLQQKKYFAAIGTGLDAIKLLEEATELDSSNAEADFFLGIYNYARAELKKRLWMVMFWYGGDKQEGIDRLVRCSKNAKITSPSARLSLADIYIEEKQPEKARIILDSLIVCYPDSRFVMWTYTKYFLATGDTARAADVFERLSASYSKYRYGRLNSLKTLYMQAFLLGKTGKKNQACAIAGKAAGGRCLSCAGPECDVCKDIKAILEKGGCNADN
jgi:tetratricopeptide (TPR) repeat protein